MRKASEGSGTERTDAGGREPDITSEARLASLGERHGWNAVTDIHQQKLHRARIISNAPPASGRLIFSYKHFAN